MSSIEGEEGLGMIEATPDPCSAYMQQIPAESDIGYRLQATSLLVLVLDSAIECHAGN